MVASFTDAWIETYKIKVYGLKDGSHLLQMRGLKQKLSDLSYSPFQSHLLQMRGLKLVQQWRAFGVYVASFTDAWIETLPSKGIQ